MRLSYRSTSVIARMPAAETHGLAETLTQKIYIVCKGTHFGCSCIQRKISLMLKQAHNARSNSHYLGNTGAQGSIRLRNAAAQTSHMQQAEATLARELQAMSQNSTNARARHNNNKYQYKPER